MVDNDPSTVSAAARVAAQVPHKDRRKQPASVYLLSQLITGVIFAAFSVRVLLVLYLTQALKLPDADATVLYGSYNALSFLLPVVLAPAMERSFGAKQAVVIGCALMVGGLCGLAAATAYPALGLAAVTAALAVVGTGFSCVKPAAIITMGQQFGEGDHAGRDAAFSLYYSGINLGAFAASLVVGWVGQKLGWSQGFLLGAVILTIAALLFHRGMTRSIESGSDKPSIPRLYGLAALVAAGGAYWLLLTQTLLLGWALAVGTLAGVGFLLWRVHRLGDRAAFNRQIALVLLMIIVVTAFGIIEQGGSSLALFAERNVALTALGLPLTAAQLLMLNPLFVIALGPLMGRVWEILESRGVEVSFRAKLITGLLLVSVAPGALVLGCWSAVNGTVAFGWIVLFWLVAVLGELCVGPVGYATATRLAVPRYAGQTIGVWLLAMANSNYVAGQLASLASVDRAQTATPTATLPIYEALFTKLLLAGLGIFVVVLVLSPLIRRLTPDNRSTLES